MKNHGYIKPEKRTKPQPVAIPRVLRRSLLFTSDRETSERTYGLWEMKALEDLHVCGVPVKKGELFKLPGNEAVLLARDRTAEFTDSRLAEETETLEKVKKLGLDKPAQPDPLNFPAPEQPRRDSWPVKKGAVAA